MDQAHSRLADEAIQELHGAIRAAKGILQVLAQGSPSQQQQQQQADGPSQQQPADVLAARQQEYLTHTQALRSRIQALYQQHDAAQQAAQEEALQGPGEAMELVQLQQRRDALVQQVNVAAEVEAQLMTQARGLLDAFLLWDNHKRHLETAPRSAR